MSTKKLERRPHRRTAAPKRYKDGSVDAAAFLRDLDGPLTFGAAIRALRESEEWTQAALAERLGTTKQHISDVELDRKVVSADRAAAWARVLGQSERVFLQLALQDELRRADLAYTVRLESA